MKEKGLVCQHCTKELNKETALYKSYKKKNDKSGRLYEFNFCNSLCVQLFDIRLDYYSGPFKF